jgi:hypothetical protein
MRTSGRDEHRQNAVATRMGRLNVNAGSLFGLYEEPGRLLSIDASKSATENAPQERIALKSL